MFPYAIRIIIAPTQQNRFPCFCQTKALKQRSLKRQRGGRGWRSDESARLPSMCPGFDSRTRRHKWIEFVVSYRPCSEGFSPGFAVFLPPQKATFLNSNSIGNSRAKGLSVEDCCVSPSLNKVHLFIYIYLQ